MQPIWYNYERKRVHSNFDIISLDIWMWRMFMHFKAWWMTWTLLVKKKNDFILIYEVCIDEWRRVSKPLEIVHSNIYEPMRMISMGGTRYFINFINNFLKKVSVLKSKEEYV